MTPTTGYDLPATEDVRSRHLHMRGLGHLVARSDLETDQDRPEPPCAFSVRTDCPKSGKYLGSYAILHG